MYVCMQKDTENYKNNYCFTILKKVVVGLNYSKTGGSRNEVGSKSGNEYYIRTFMFRKSLNTVAHSFRHQKGFNWGNRYVYINDE